MFADAFDLEPSSQDSLKTQSPFIFWIQRLDSTMSRALGTLMQTRYDLEEPENSYPLQGMIKLFDQDITKIKRDSEGHLGTPFHLFHSQHY